MVTKAKITELLRRRLADGNPSVNDKVKDEEIHVVIGLAANKLLKTETLNSFQFEGNTIIEGAVINTYENQPVIKHGKYSRVKLPVAPLLLPGGLGVFSVCEYGNPENEFIYIPMGVFNMFKKEKLLSPMQINFYSFDNEYVIVYSDLISAGISSVDLKICSMDIDKVGQFDMLPIEQGMVSDIVNYCYAFFDGGIKTE